MKLKRIRMIIYLGILFFYIQPASAALSCTIATQTNLAFGSYSVFSAVNDTTVGSIRVRCIGSPFGSIPISLSKGSSGSYVNRTLKSGTNILDYNLYTTSSYTSVWGDGSSGTVTVLVPGLGNRNFSIYGRILAGQDAAVGTYSDIIVAKVTF